MPNYLLDAKLSQAVYSSNNRNDTAVIDGWKPIALRLEEGRQVAPTFGAQLYEKDGHYKLVFRGTEMNQPDWQRNLEWGMNHWTQEWDDTIAFTAAAILHVRSKEDAPDMSAVRSRLTVTGHSQGGFQSQLSGRFFGLDGTSMDGMGAQGLIAQPEFQQLKQQYIEDYRFQGLTTSTRLSSFHVRVYTSVGMLGLHGADVTTSWALSNVASFLPMAFAATGLGLVAAGAAGRVVGLGLHPIGSIIQNETWRAKNPVYRIIGAADGDPLETADAVSQAVANDLLAETVAGPGGAPDSVTYESIRSRVGAFLQDRIEQQITEERLLDATRLTADDGAELLIYRDGSGIVSSVAGNTTSGQLFRSDGTPWTTFSQTSLGGGRYISESSIVSTGVTTVMTVNPDALTPSITEIYSNAQKTALIARVDVDSTGALQRTLVSNDPSYAFSYDGNLIRFLVPEDYSTAEIVTGPNAGNIEMLQVAGGGSSDLRTITQGMGGSAIVGYTLSRTDQQGRAVTVSVEPYTLQAGSETITGVQRTETSSINGIQISTATVINYIDGTGNAVTKVDSSRYDAATGEAVDRRVVETVKAGDQLVREHVSNYDGVGALLESSLTTRTPTGSQVELFNSNNVLTQKIVTTDVSWNRQIVSVEDGSGRVVFVTKRQIVWDDEGPGYLDEVLNTATGEVKLVGYLRDPVTGQEVGRKEAVLLEAGSSEERLRDQLYSDASSFLSAVRGKDKVGMLVYGAKMALDYARLNDIANPDLAGASNFLDGVSGTMGVIGALKALQSDDLLTQLNGGVNLLRGTDAIYRSATGGQAGYLNEASSELLSQFGAILSIANLINLADMIENGQIGSAAFTSVNAINAAAYLGGTAPAASGATAFIPMDLTTLIIFVVVVVLLDDFFAEEPPPPPPLGEAVFKRLANGSLGYEILNAANGGHEILAGQMDALIGKLTEQLGLANDGNANPDLALQLIAGRMPKITIQSWPSFDVGNNYFFVIEQIHPQSGDKVYSGIARQDLVKHFAESLVLPEAIAQQWQVNHLAAKFGADEANWKTEGQWLAAQSPIEQERQLLKQALVAAEEALALAKQTQLQRSMVWVADGDATGNVERALAAAQQSAADAEAVAVAAKTALAAFGVEHPADPQWTARIVDAGISDPAQLQAAREGAARQWLKVIALDLGGDGIQKTDLPGTVGKDLQSLQTDGVTRFDTDNDGYREATEWIAPSEAMLGMDRNGNGLIDLAGELFNAISTSFDKRGLASLKYYDSNNDNRIDANDPVYKLLRLWIDLNGDGSAGQLETYDLQMRHPGVDMAALSARLDAAGRAALAMLQNSAVEYIDLVTFKFHLADQTTAQASEVALQSEVEGVRVVVDEATQNVSVLHENGLRENYITLVRDMGVLLELDDAGIPAARRTELEALALRYGLNTQADDFMNVVRSLRAGGENLGGAGTAIYLGNDDVWADPNVRQRLEQMRFSFHSAQSVGSADVFGTARFGMPIEIGAGTTTPVFNDHWAAPHRVVQGEVTSDTPAAAAPPAPNPEQWVLLADVYNLDHVVKGAQLGGLVTQQAVIASNAAAPNAPQQTIQVYTAATPTLSLSAVTLQGREDQQFGFGFAQLEQEARTLIPDASDFAAVRLLGVRAVAHGRVEIDEALGRVRFIADTNYYGAEGGFTYAVMDEQGRVMDRRVNFILAEVNDAPTLLGETVQAQEDVPLLLDAATLLANDTDLESDTLSIIGIGRVGIGRAELLANGQIRYTPPTDLYGVTDTIEYIVQDARGGSAVAVVKITLSAVDDAPTVVSEVIRHAKEDTNLRIDPALLLANDFDPDFDNRIGATQLRITAVGNATHGMAFIDASGHIMFVPAQNFNGKASFEYTVTDLTGLSTTGTAEVEVGAVNDGPRAFGELITSQEDEKLVIDPDLLLANDDDIDIGRGENQRLMVVAVDQAVNGTVKLENGHISFTPTNNHTGEASFRYTVSDGSGGFAQAIARIDVNPVNDGPTVLSRSYIGQEDTAYRFTATHLLDGVLDPEDGATGVHLVRVEAVTGGTLQEVNGEYVLTPGANFNGIASFNYVVADAQGLESNGTVAVKFSEVNDAPIFIPGSAFTKQGEEDQAVRIAVSALKKMFIDVDGDAIEIDVANMAAVNAGDAVTYDAARQEIVFTGAANANGLRQFDIRVMDAHGAYSATQRLSVDLKALNDSPVVSAIAFDMLEDGGWNNPKVQATTYLSYTQLLSTSQDAEGDVLSIGAITNGTTGDGRAVTLRPDDVLRRVGIVAPLNYNGTVSFDFTVTDGKGGSTTQKAFGRVVAVDDVPTLTAVNVVSTFAYDQWRLEASDVDGTIVGYGIDRHPLRGTIEMGMTLHEVVHPIEGVNGDQTGSWSFFHSVPGEANDLVIRTIDGKGYMSETQTAVMTATDSGGNVAKANLNFVFRWDPIVIDMDSDGLEFLDIDQSSVLIDRNGDGVAERSAWVKGTEGILAWDHNADGVINRYDEIEFWSHVRPEDPTRTDLQSLARPEFDSNQDGLFNQYDVKWSAFKLWRDVNENGVSDAGELVTLGEAGVAALHLSANVLNRRYGSDVVVRGYTRLEMTDGRMLQAGDVQLSMTDPTTPSSATAPTGGQQQAGASTVRAYQAALQQEQAALAAVRRAGDPHFSGALRDHKVLTGQDYSYVLPATLFAALGDDATYAVTLANGQALPAWLEYDAAMRTLSGTPELGQQGNWAIKVTGTATAGGATSSGVMTLEVTPFNQAPIAYGHIPVQFALEDESFALDIAPNFFIDREAGDSLRYSATLAGGVALPAWLTFDPQTLTFHGTPPSAAVGLLEIVLRASDEANAGAETKFKLVVAGVNDAPVVANAPGMVGMRVGEANHYVLPADMFIDEDVGDTLQWTATQANGDPLPSWLTFDPADHSLNGAPAPQQLAAPIQLRVTATDMSGASTSTLVTVTSSIYGTEGDDGYLAGSAYSEDILGGAGNDLLAGLGGADRLIGGTGDDGYIVDGLDTIIERDGEGEDTVYSPGTWTLDDTLENLVLQGTQAINGTGNALNNALWGNSAANVLTGGGGNDVYVIAAGDTVVENAGEGSDLVIASVTYTLGANLETLLLGDGDIDGTGNALDNAILGGAGNNILDGAGGADWMAGGAGNDTYIVDADDMVVENAGEGIDGVVSAVSHTLAANVENLTLTGTAAADATGNALDNLIKGNAAANVLTGGAGDDTYHIGGSDTIVEVAGEGIDSVVASMTYTLTANVENLTIVGGLAVYGTGNTLDNVLTGNGVGSYLWGGTGNDTYVLGANDRANENAGEGTDTVLTSVNGHILAINVENLTLTGVNAISGTGNALDNVLTGNGAANVLRGGAGNDTYVVGAGDSVIEDAGEGTDTVQASVSYALEANAENLTLTGTGNFNGTGNSANNTLRGNAGNNVLTAGEGADTLLGGAGDDTYYIDGSDTVVEAAGAGTDTVISTASYVLGDHIENVTLSGSGAINATGNAGSNILIGNSGNNVLNGGLGIDTMIGGAGSDTYHVDNAADVVVETVSSGTDRVISSVSYTLSALVDDLDLVAGAGNINGTGNSEVNRIVGNDGNNVLDGGAGADKLAGKAGDDTYIVDNSADTVAEDANQGVDSVLSSVSYSLVANLENLTLTGGAAINGTGNAGDNVLTGNSAVNVLTGGAGNDTYVVGAGDTVVETVTTTQTVDQGYYATRQVDQGYDATRQVDRGYYSYDEWGSATWVPVWQTETYWQAVWVTETYWVSNWVQQTSNTDAGGLDAVQSSVSFTLANYVENLTLTGTAAVNGTGNALNNVLTGNTAANVLAGGGGNDTYYIEQLDTVTEAAGAGFDTVVAGFSYTLAANIENVVLSGVDAVNATGNTLDNTLQGNAALNVLTGGAGNDTYVADASDVVVEAADEGTDTVRTSGSYVLGANVENLYLTDTADVAGTGNSLANYISGNAGNNALDGGAGADTLAGGLGNDTYTVDSTDTVIEYANEGVETVLAGFTYALGANVENLVLTGSAAINGTGNAGNNVLTGNGAANVLTGGAGNDTYVVGVGDTVVETVTTTQMVDQGYYAQRQVDRGYYATRQVDRGYYTYDEWGNATWVSVWETETYWQPVWVTESYWVSNWVQQTTVSDAGGVDTIHAAVGYTLGAYQENLTLTGVAAINGVGNALNNVMYGNTADNMLDGGAGADTMAGGAGNDVYALDSSSDVAAENAGEGTDTVNAAVTYSLAANVENLTLTGTAVINATGNILDNVLTGNGAANVLTGGAGNDTYVVGAGDNVVENVGEGTDLVQASVTYTLATNVENLTLAGTAAINGTGNAANNVLNGNSASNVLTGGAGNDTYVLGRGSGSDTIQESDAAAGNTDVVQFLSSVAVDQLWFKQAGNNLEVSIIGTADKFTLSNWYLGSQYRAEQFKTTDGSKTLLESQVQNLVNAMASFAAPAVGQTTLPANYAASLQPVIAANWQ